MTPHAAFTTRARQTREFIKYKISKIRLFTKHTRAIPCASPSSAAAPRVPRVHTR